MLTKDQMEVIAMQSFNLGLTFIILLSFFSMGGCDNGDSVVDLPGSFNSSQDFDHALATDLAELSLVAYEQRLQCISGGSSTITVPSGYKLEQVIYSQVNNLNDSCKDMKGVVPIAFIATKGDGIYLAFRGTANVTDSFEDILITQDKYTFVSGGGRTESGFTETYEGSDKHPVREPMFTKVKELVDSGKYNTLYITGHSLGAALAVLAFPDLSENTSIKSVFMYNFAGPAVGDDTFVPLYDSIVAKGNHTSWRIVNTNDVIPLTPPQGMHCQLFFYDHVQDEARITFGVTPPPFPILTCKTLQIFQALSDYISGTSGGRPNKDIIQENHSMCTYFDTICKTVYSQDECKSRAVGCD